MRQGDSDIVEEQIVRRSQQYDYSGYDGTLLEYPHHAVRDTRSVIIEHWTRRLAYPGDVRAISLVYDFGNRKDIGGSCSSYGGFVGHQRCQSGIQEGGA